MVEQKNKIVEVHEECEIKLPVLSLNRQYMNNTKISRILPTKILPIEEIPYTCEIQIDEKVTTLLEIWKDENTTLSTNTITQFDSAVMDTVYTIICSGYMVFTEEWVARGLSSNPKKKITPKKIEEIRKSIEKLRHINIKIDCEDEFNARKDTKEKIDKKIYQSHMLPVDMIETQYKVNGKKVSAYQVIKKPAHYEYAEIVHQIIDVPADLLDTHKEFEDTDEAILIKRYVIKRVEQILNDNELDSNKISFYWYDKETKEEHGLFSELGYKQNDSRAWRDKRNKINKIVRITLKSLKDKKEIEGFEEYRKDGTKNPASPIMGYKIFFNKKKRRKYRRSAKEIS